MTKYKVCDDNIGIAKRQRNRAGEISASSGVLQHRAALQKAGSIKQQKHYNIRINYGKAYVGKNSILQSNTLDTMDKGHCTNMSER